MVLKNYFTALLKVVRQLQQCIDELGKFITLQSKASSGHLYQKLLKSVDFYQVIYK